MVGSPVSGPAVFVFGSYLGLLSMRSASALKAVTNVLTLVIAVWVSWATVTVLVPTPANVRLTPGTTLDALLVLLYCVAVVTPFWVMVYEEAAPYCCAAPARCMACKKLPVVSERLMLCAPVAELVRVTLSLVGSYVAVTPADDALMRFRTSLMLS